MTVSKRRVWIVALVATIASSAANVGNFLQAYATSDNDIVSQVLIQDLQVCYTNGKFNSNITVDLSSFYGLTNEWTFAPRLPNGFSNKDTIKCGDIVQSLYGPNPRTADGLIEMLDYFGYEPASTNEPYQKCISFKFNRYSSGDRAEVRTQQICAEVDANGNVIGDKFTIGADGTDNMNTFFFLPDEGCYGCLAMSRNDGQGMYNIASISVHKDKPWSELEAVLTDEISRQFDTQNNLTYNPLGADIEDKKNATTYVLKDDPFWQSTYASQFRKFSNTEIVYTYQRYLQMYATIVCTSDPSDIAVLTGTTQNGGYRQVKIAGKSGYNENCFVKLKDSAPSSFHGFTSDGYWNIDVSFDDILNTLGAITLTPEELEELDSNIDNSDNDPGDLTDKPDTSGPTTGSGPVTATVVDQDDCMKVGGAMGWIICPVTLALKDALSDLYDRVIEPMLQVSSSLMNRGSGTYKAWNTFRDVANIFFVIMILIVIFSQVTGYGIDNYGIKRMLPKLVATAVLINASFIICQLAVDVSNIIGSSLNSFFISLSDAPAQVAFTGSTECERCMVVQNGVVSGAGFMGNMIGLLFDFIIVAAAGLLAFSFFTGLGSMLMTILITLLGVMVSVLFMFLSLGLRMVGVVVLTAIAPLAFIAYALPNTNSLFRKWLDAFKALLLLYPICGLLVGGGQFASIVVLNTLPNTTSNDVLTFFYVVVAIFVSILPFFAMPALLKKSMQATGLSAISTFGSNLRNRISGIRNTEGYKRASIGANNAWQNTKFFQNRMKGIQNSATGSRFRPVRAISGAASRYGARQMARTSAAYQKMENENVQAEGELMNRIAPASYEDVQSNYDRAINSGDSHAARVAAARAEDMGRAKDLATHIGAQLDSLKDLSDPEQKRILQGIKDSIDKKGEVHKQLTAKDTAASMMVNDGRSDKTLSEYTKEFAAKADVKDLSTQNTQSLVRMANSGALSPGLARQVLSSTDPAVQSGIQSDPGKRQIFEALASQPDIGPSAISDYGNAAQVRQQAEKYVQGRTEQAELQVRRAQADFARQVGESVAQNINNPGNPNP